MEKSKEETPMNVTDDNSEKDVAGTSKRKPLPEKCKLCRTGKREIYCEVCILDDYV